MKSNVVADKKGESSFGVRPPREAPEGKKQYDSFFDAKVKFQNFTGPHTHKASLLEGPPS
ncbi:unnamed protein product [Prunus armeniaca]|uniref:Uncharacterized protein n=1 Tax=Prunus armeniaca TaxID=36596 RepID=A0A6J5U9T0_PRUAR|nr:unnamed protein product [Prunus armeniaca]